MSIWDQVEQQVSSATGSTFQIQNKTSVGGGCINSAYRIDDNERSYFVKTNRASLVDMFEAEFAGLEEMQQSDSIRVPAPICVGADAAESFLVMEYLPLGGGGSGAMEQLGQNLAAMHRKTNTQYGWHRENTIGSTPQHNDQMDSWADFWRDHRLGFQLDLAARNGYGGHLQRRGEALLEKVGDFFQDHQPTASLLHGDLWSGNYSITENGEPVIFDPATYYGDREADIAMTELFGGFPGRFYDAYNEAFALDPGYSVRKKLYNLYHILNHLNLFGGGYLGQSESMIESLLAEC